MRLPLRSRAGLALALALLLSGFAAAPAWSHAMPEHASPEAGAVLKRGPTEVRIVFDEVLQPGRCDLRVEDEQSRVVSRDPAHVDPNHPRQLSVALPPLDPGRYHVYWVAVSLDGHRTTGDYTFTVSGGGRAGDAAPTR